MARNRIRRSSTAVVMSALLFAAVFAGCGDDGGGCGDPDQKFDLTMTKIGDEAGASLDVIDGYYSPFLALDSAWQVTNPGPVLAPKRQKVRGTLTMIDAYISEADKSIVRPKALRFQPHDGSDPVEFTTYGCA